MTDFANDLELIGDFVTETRDHLSAIETQLLTLDQNPGHLDTLHAIFRGFHSIKGLAGFLGLEQVQEVAHEVETILDLARNSKIRITARHVDVVLESKDYLNRWLSALEKLQGGGPKPDIPLDAALLVSIRSLATESPAPVPETLSALSKTQDALEEKSADARSIKVDTRKLDSLVDLVGELVIAQSLVQHESSARNLTQLARITAEVQRTAMSMRMIPIRHLFQKMSRLVRDLARKTGKKVDLDLIGEETELDRNMVEELADPLMHMIRNSVDHGVEPREDRIRAGKTETARVVLKAGHQGGHIVVEVRDDGRGLDPEKIVRKARERGLATDGDPFQLIFAPGFSTAEQVTAVSGRGVGMDVVKRQIEKLRGKIEIQSTLGKGASFLLKLPLTLAIVDGLLVGVGIERYVIPIFAVREIFRPEPDQISTMENRDEMLLLRGSVLPILRLHQRFGVQPRSEDLCRGVMIVVESEARRYCLFVDELLGKQEVVIKSMGEALAGIRGVGGAAILGDGRVGLIVDPETL